MKMLIANTLLKAASVIAGKEASITTQAKAHLALNKEYVESTKANKELVDAPYILRLKEIYSKAVTADVAVEAALFKADIVDVEYTYVGVFKYTPFITSVIKEEESAEDDLEDVPEACLPKVLAVVSLISKINQKDSVVVVSVLARAQETVTAKPESSYTKVLSNLLNAQQGISKGARNALVAFIDLTKEEGFTNKHVDICLRKIFN